MSVPGETIAAIATAAGEGGIAVVRVSGSGARAVAAEVLARRCGGAVDLEARRAVVAWAREPATGRLVDEVLALWMPAPASYTTEDVLEVQCHGGSAAAGAVLGAVLAAGARLAEPGEFTLRAFLGGRIDLVQAEAVLDVIRAETSEALGAHQELLEGRLTREVEGWQTGLGKALVRLEADLDFPEEDLGALDGEGLVGELERIAGAMGERLGTFSWGRAAREGFRVVLVGAPNVGKSSLLNILAGEDRAIVSSRPGTTRDAIEVRVNARGVPVCLVDTAGLRACGDQLEEEGVRRARRAAEGANLVLFVCDGGRSLSTEEEEEARQLEAGGRTLPVVNKSDLGAIPVGAVGALFGREAVQVSALTGEGIGELLGVVRDAAWGGGGPSAGTTLTRTRHQEAVRAAMGCVERAVDGLRMGRYLEVVAGDLQAARRHLGALLGREAPEDVLEAIFREFCIGK